MTTPTTPIDTTQFESDQRLDHPWALWEAFRGLRSWFFRRGLPPTLDHPRFAVRLLRMIVLMGALGMLSAALVAIECGVELVLQSQPIMVGKPPGGVWFPGVTFGFVVLMSLSRWQGRNWLLEAAAVPVSVAVYLAAAAMFYVGFPFYEGNKWLSGGFNAGLISGFSLAIWMSPASSRPSLRVIGITLVAAILGSLNFALIAFSPAPFARHVPVPLLNVLMQVAMYGPFHVLVAIALGTRLIINRNVDPELRPLATEQGYRAVES